MTERTYLAALVLLAFGIAIKLDVSPIPVIGALAILLVDYIGLTHWPRRRRKDIP